MARRILNRKELRNDYDAAERRKQDDETGEEVQDEEEAEGEDDEEDEDEEQPEEEGEGEDEAGEDDEEAPKPKKKKKAPAKPKAKPRTRTPKVTRMKVVWGVFNNSNQRVATYEYPKRKEADDHAAKLTADKKSTHFVQPVKEPIEEKKEA
jgi:cobalamin biosynthesis protein CobT